jgi:hypothetical protein
MILFFVSVFVFVLFTSVFQDPTKIQCSQHDTILWATYVAFYEYNMTHFIVKP